ncbi:MAG: bifunctional adenosylcobinamide kinase/adenosylcobinamide-phosphate guanylyltransferase [Tibeticola sp.]
MLIATAQPHDAEMRERIARHRAERAQRLPGLRTVEEPLALPEAIARESRSHRLVVVDCLTLWLTAVRMPFSENLDEKPGNPSAKWSGDAMLIEAIEAAPGPLVLVGNEIGLGVIPLGREVRAFVDELGRLNQRVAAACERVTLMVAGLPLTVKGRA